MVSKHHSPLMGPRRDDDGAAIAKVQLDVLSSLLDLLLPWPNDCVPVDPHDGYDDDNDAEDDAELRWRVQAVPGIVRARRSVIAQCLAPAEHIDVFDMGSKGRHVYRSALICDGASRLRARWLACWLMRSKCVQIAVSRPEL